MYTVTLDGLEILNPKKEILLKDPVLTLTDNEAGSFSFSILQNNPGAGKINLLKSTILVNRDDETLFSGRVIDAQMDIWGTVTIECEGDLALLDDTVIPASDESQTISVEYFITLLLAAHAVQAPDKLINPGNITVKGVVQTNFNYSSTLETLKTLIDQFGGHFRMRYENGERYLDYLEDYPRTSGQTVEFAKNLVNFTQSVSARDLYTAVMPIGKDNLNITSVNEKPWIESETAVNNYGFICTAVQFPDIDDPNTLMEEGAKWLQSSQFRQLSIQVSALDLADGGADIDHINFLDKVHCISKSHGLDTEFPVTELSINLIDPTQNIYNLGTLPSSFSKSVSSFANSTDTGASTGGGGGSTPSMGSGHIWIQPSLEQPNEFYVTENTTLESSGNAFKWTGTNGLQHGYNGYYSTPAMIDKTGLVNLTGNIQHTGTDTAYTLKDGTITSTGNANLTINSGALTSRKEWYNNDDPKKVNNANTVINDSVFYSDYNPYNPYGTQLINRYLEINQGQITGYSNVQGREKGPDEKYGGIWFEPTSQFWTDPDGNRKQREFKGITLKTELLRIQAGAIISNYVDEDGTMVADSESFGYTGWFTVGSGVFGLDTNGKIIQYPIGLKFQNGILTGVWPGVNFEHSSLVPVKTVLSFDASGTTEE